MAVSPEYRAMVEELLAPLGPVAIRRMFGGAGIFQDGLMFALIAGETLYLKVDDANRPVFEAAGKGPFSYAAAGGRRAVMSYYEVPDEALDDPAALCTLARGSVEAALRSERVKRKRPPKAGA